MNRTRIEWTIWTWNPVTGCKHGCWYCYAKRLCLRFKKVFPNGFEPTFYPERLKEPWELKTPSKIFVCSIADLFASWTPTEWRDAVLKSMLQCPIKHTFQILTKNPERIPTNDVMHEYPDNWWFGTTVTGEGTGADIVNIKLIKNVPAKVRFVSFEPLLNDIDFNIYSLEGIQWVIIGKLTGSKRVKLPWSWVENILKEAGKYGIPVFIKNNIIWPQKIQQFPTEGI